MGKSDEARILARMVERAGIWQLMRAAPWPVKLLATALAIGFLWWKSH